MKIRSLSLKPPVERFAPRSSELPLGTRARMPDGATIVELLEAQAARNPERAAIHFLHRPDEMVSFTWADLISDIRRVAAGLQTQGVRTGDAVLLALETSPDLVSSFLASLYLGAVPSIMDVPFSRSRVASWKEKLRTRAAVLDARIVVAERSTVELLEELQHERVVDRVVEATDLRGAGEVSGSVPNPEGLAFFQFTSGTTSAGRAVRLTHRAVIANLHALNGHLMWRDSDCVVSWLPLHHDLGLIANLILPLTLGVPLGLMTPFQFLMRPSRWLAAVHCLRGTQIMAPNFAYEMCVSRVKDREIEGIDLSSLRGAMICAEFVHNTTMQRFSACYGEHGFDSDAWIPGYGMAETVLGATCRKIDETAVHVDRISRTQLTMNNRAVPVADAHGPDVIEIVSCGSVMKGGQLRVVDDQGNDVPERVQGEIILSGPSIFDGYHRDDPATRSTLKNGWLFTGDLGYRIGNELYVCGRHKDLIIKGGENYHPYVFEHAVSSLEGVRAGGVAALGIASSTSGTEDLVVAFETKISEPTQLAKLCSDVTNTLRNQFGVQPERVVPVAPGVIPKTTSGKIRRRALIGSLDQHDKWRASDREPLVARAG